MTERDYNFVTDRLAIGNVASRATPGFCAVVSVLATDRPGTLACEMTGAPAIPQGLFWPSAEHCYEPERVPWLHIDLADGEERQYLPVNSKYINYSIKGRGLEDYLDDATSFIAAHIRRGCVLVHCGAGKSRSVAVVIAYLCRYAGMSLTEALAFVSARRPGACPAPCFIEAIKRWLRLDELATGGPRRWV